MTTLNAKKTLAGAMALSLVLSGCLLIGNGRAAAVGSAGLSVQGHSIVSYTGLKELQNRWRKQAHELGKSGPRIVEEAAGLLGMDKDALNTLLQGGKSIAEIAAEKGIPEAELVSKLMTGRLAKLEEGVKEGKLTRERADTIKARMESHISFKLKQKGLENEDEPGLHHGKGKHHEDVLPHLGPSKLSSMLGIDKDVLIRELKDGKSLADIAEAKGISKEELIGKIKDELTPALEKAIERKAPAARR